MSAIGKTMYAMKCDHPDLCSAELQTYDGGSWLYDTADEARKAAYDYDWVHVDGKDYCPRHAPGREVGDEPTVAESWSQIDGGILDEWAPNRENGTEP